MRRKRPPTPSPQIPLFLSAGPALRVKLAAPQ